MENTAYKRREVIYVFTVSPRSMAPNLGMTPVFTPDQIVVAVSDGWKAKWDYQDPNAKDEEQFITYRLRDGKAVQYGRTWEDTDILKQNIIKILAKCLRFNSTSHCFYSVSLL